MPPIVGTNRWTVGAMYQGGLVSGLPFFTQPGGVGTQVFPSQQNAQPWVEYPVIGEVINEYQPWWPPGCLHSVKFWKIYKEFDYVTQLSCALICCPICTYVQRVVEPYDEILDPIAYAIIM